MLNKIRLYYFIQNNRFCSSCKKNSFCSFISFCLFITLTIANYDKINGQSSNCLCNNDQTRVNLTIYMSSEFIIITKEQDNGEGTNATRIYQFQPKSAYVCKREKLFNPL